MFGKKTSTPEKSESSKACPFFFGYKGALVKQAALDAAKCLKEKCMLWNEQEQDCNINVIAKRLK